ncbi:MAG: putative rane protein [Fibrobacteres bacterium]|nr:putative rane protein [Fibrobacterota bacterium]
MKSRTFMIINLLVSAIAVAFLFWLLYLRKGQGEPSALSFLPAVNAALNATTTVFLLRGWLAIKAGNRVLHAFCQKTAFIVSAVFLVCYIVYHSVHGDTHFPGQGLIKPVYFSILISHIGLSIVALPMILATFFFALTGRFATHRKLARITFPIWLYVSITGVVIFAVLKAYT